MATTNLASAQPLPNGLSSYETEKAKSAASSNTLGQDQFLKLMTAQLKNQDPMKPMDNGEFLGQMAQFSTVAGISDMAKQLTTLSEQMAANRLLTSGSLIGRQVLSEGNYGELTAEAPLEGTVRLPVAADGATVAIKNARGEVMETLNLGPSVAGDYPFSWDGRFKDGSVASPGVYKVDVTVSRAGKSETARALLFTRVNSVSMDGTEVNLNLQNGSLVALSKVSTMR